MTIEDEGGIANIIVWKKVFERDRSIVLGSRLIRVKGKLQSQSGVIHIVAEAFEDLTPWLADLSEAALTIDATTSRADEVRHPVNESRGAGLTKAKIDQLTAQARVARESNPELARVLRESTAELARASAKVMPKGRNFQ